MGTHDRNANSSITNGPKLSNHSTGLRILRLDVTKSSLHSHFFLYVRRTTTQCGISTTESTTTIQFNLHNYNYSWSRGFREVKSLLMVGTCVYSISFHSIVGRFLALSLFSTLGRSGMLSRTIMVEVSSNHFVRIQCWWLA